MGMRVFLAAALTLLCSTAFAEHAFTLEPDTAPGAAPAPATPPAVAPATPPAVAPAPPIIVQVPQAAPQPAPQVQATLPSEVDVYLVTADSREVCTVSDWGYGEIRRDCRTEALPPSHGNPALRGICTTRYGLRTCY
jgi:hypothetical protein